jgi:hypothetical protein
VTVGVGAVCRIHTAGADPNGAHSDELSADGEDGKLRFFAPPSDWGRSLSVECASRQADGTLGPASSTKSVNLDDPTTFEAEAVQAPVVARTLPALTGDLLALSPQWLQEQGYLPRPDPTTNPDRYARWVAAVTKPADVYKSKGVAALGQHAANYKGRVSTGPGPSWAGQVLDHAGFSSGVPNRNPYYYVEYDFTTTIPYTQPPGGQVPDRAVVWGGLGGYDDGALIQNGFGLNESAVWSFYEFYQAAAPGHSGWTGPEIDVSLPSGWASNDTVEIYGGYSASTSVCGTGHAPCGWYNEYNHTRGSYIGQTTVAENLSSSYDQYTGNTYEFIVEGNNTPSQAFADFNGLWLNGGRAWDYNGTSYNATTDAWLYLDGVNGGDLLAHAYNPNSPNCNTSSPVCPDTDNVFVQWVQGL